MPPALMRNAALPLSSRSPPLFPAIHILFARHPIGSLKKPLYFFMGRVTTHDKGLTVRLVLICR